MSPRPTVVGWATEGPSLLSTLHDAAGRTMLYRISLHYTPGHGHISPATFRCIGAQAAMTHVLAGLRLGLRGRPDAAWFAQQEQGALESVQQLLPK